MQIKGNSINQQTLSLASLSKNGIILNKPSSGKNSYSIKPSIAPEQIAATPTPLENPSTPSSSAPRSSESRVFSKCHDDFRIEQVENLRVEVTALKSFIMEQLYVIKKSVEDFRSENSTPNNLELIETLKEEIRYLRNENITKTYIIKSLTENQATDHVKETTHQKTVNGTLPSRQNQFQKLGPRKK